MLPLLVLGLIAPAMAQDQPPPNATAVEPYWPHYPTSKSADDFMMNNNASAADIDGSSALAQWIVTASNVFRAQFGSQPVTWNASCAHEADVHAKSCRWEHWGSDNLASLSSSDEDARFDINPMIEMWAQEWDYYPFRHPEAEAFSHFTAMVWNESTTVGCSWNVDCPDTPGFPSRTYFVCNYWPPGNLGTKPPGKEYFANVGNYTKWVNAWQVPDPPFNMTEDHGGAPSVNVTINGTNVVTIVTPQTTGAVSPNHGSGSATPLGVSLALVALGLAAALAI